MVFGIRNIKIFFCIVFLLFVWAVIPCFAENVKWPNVAGSFYPAQEEELKSLISKYLKDAGEVSFTGEPLVLISPHAGYIYSAPVAAYGYKSIKDFNFDTVIILAPSHYFSFAGVDVYREGLFKTPLGGLSVNAELASDILNKAGNLAFSNTDYFQREHSLEVQLPFLQFVFGNDIKIVPILFGRMSYEDCLQMGKYIFDSTGNSRVLVLVSTDLSHYKTYEEAVGYDSETIALLSSMDIKGLWDSVAGTGWNVCGVNPLVTGIYFSKLKGGDRVKILKYATSADTSHDKSSVVGYVSAIILGSAPQEFSNKNAEDEMLTKDDKKKLLEIARASCEASSRGESFKPQKLESPGMNLKRGAFVTLHKHGNLRGCIGMFTSNEPLYRVVSQMAREASLNDYRFGPVEPDETKDIDIEISVLTEPQLIDDWRSIRLGVDGVIVKRGYNSGVFLPQVATETGWDLDTFLSQLCSQKAGLSSDAYKDPQTRIYTFQAIIFSEKDI